MKHELIDDRARVWIVMRGPDNCLKEELYPELLAKLNPAHSAEEVADTLVQAAGAMEVAETRVW